MSGLDGIFGLIGVGCGLYCLYGYYMLRYKGEIIQSLFLPKNTNMKKCRDLKGYSSEAQMPALVLGIIVLVYGAVDLYNTYVHGVAAGLLAVMIILVFAAVIFFSLKIKKINKKYFDI